MQVIRAAFFPNDETLQVSDVRCRVCDIPSIISITAPGRLCKVCRADLEATRTYVLSLDISARERGLMLEEIDAYEEAARAL